MTVSSTTSSETFACNGVTTVFVAPFRVLEASAVHCSIITIATGESTPLTNGIHFTVSGVGSANTNVTTAIAYSALYQFHVKRITARLQETDYRDNDPFPAESHETGLDRLTYIVQEDAETLSRALLWPDGETAPDMPSWAERASKVWSNDENGNLVFIAPAGGSDTALALALANPASATEGAAMVAFNDTLPYAAGTVGAALKATQVAGSFTLYVAPAGNDANDGSLGAPFATLQRAFDELMAAGVVKSATINLAAGTYNTSTNKLALLGPGNESEILPNADIYASSGASPVNWVVITGPDVGYDPATNPWPTPTAIFDGGGSASEGIRFNSGQRVILKNVKMINYNGSASSGGITASRSWLRTENVHTDNCQRGISCLHGALEVRGGKVNGNAGARGSLVGIRSQFASYHSIGSQSAVTAGQGPLITNCNYGILAQEGATGHADKVSFEDNNIGAYVTVNSRINYTGSDFKRNGVGLRVDNNSVIYADAGTANFHHLSADANGEDTTLQSGAHDINRDPYSNTVQISDYLVTPKVVTGSLSTQIVLSKPLLFGQFAPILYTTRKPQHIEGQAFGNISTTLLGGVQFKFRVDIAVTSASVSPPAAAASNAGGTDFVIDFSIVFLAPNLQRLYIKVTFHNYGVVYCDVDESSVNMNSGDFNLQLQCQLTNAADIVTFNHVHFKTFG